MGANAKAPKPRQGKRKRSTTLSLDPEVWDQLKEIERRTDARPSAVANRLLSEALAREAKTA